MRKVFASLLAFFASFVAGGLVAQALAVWTGAGEEYIAVFFLIAPVAIVAALFLFVAQFFANASKAVDRAAIGLLAICALAFAGLIAWTFMQPPAQRDLGGDLRMIAGLVVPGLAIIGVQWLIVRNMLPQAYQAAFGRSQTPT